MFHVKHKVTDRSARDGGARNKSAETKWLTPTAKRTEGAAGELFADTETGKYLAQQIVGTELAGNG